MNLKVALVYNDPIPDRYTEMGEGDAIADVLEEVKAVGDALVALGHEFVKVPLVPPIEKAREVLSALDCDLFFNLFEGFAGRPETEAMVAAVMATLCKPFTGSSAATIALALDKALAKELFLAAGIDTPRFQILTPETVARFDLAFPVIVKPAAEDASHGVTPESVVGDHGALAAQVERISTGYGGRALVEEYIDGREFSVTIIGHRRPIITAISEIEFSLPEGMPKVLTFGAKWNENDLYFDHTAPVCPAKISEELERRISRVAVAAFLLLGCHGYARADVRMDDQGRICLIEVNPNPDVAPTVVWDARLASIGLSYPQFIERVINLAFDRE
ncbi:MAG: ATP-grasp domain-containing protein [Dehalococcoidia bacterium]|nr:ATP-grasp domain-containing protein [Dehalococcoidia bacterium]